MDDGNNQHPDSDSDDEYLPDPDSSNEGDDHVHDPINNAEEAPNPDNKDCKSKKGGVLQNTQTSTPQLTRYGNVKRKRTAHEMEQNRISANKYYHANKEKVRVKREASRKRYRARESTQQHEKEYRIRNADRIAEANFRRYYANHEETLRKGRESKAKNAPKGAERKFERYYANRDAILETNREKSLALTPEQREQRRKKANENYQKRRENIQKAEKPARDIHTEKTRLKRNERARKYYQANKEARKETSRQYYHKNKARISERAREHYIANSEKIKDRVRQYGQNNKEKVEASTREYYAANHEEIKDRSRKWYHENKERARERHQDYYAANKDTIKDRVRQYHRDNREQINAKARLRCEKKKAAAQPSTEDDGQDPEFPMLELDDEDDRGRQDQGGYLTIASFNDNVDLAMINISPHDMTAWAWQQTIAIVNDYYNTRQLRETANRMREFLQYLNMADIDLHATTREELTAELEMRLTITKSVEEQEDPTP